MRFVTFDHKGQRGLGILGDDSTIVPIGGREEIPACMTAFIEAGKPALEAARRLARAPSDRLALDEVTLLAPIPRPRNAIYCVGRNYLPHVKETNPDNPVPEFPIIFTKPSWTVIGPGAAVDLHPELTASVDYEGELAVVIGSLAVNVPEEKALDHVFGYTVLNDVTARDLQKRHTQWTIGKGLDTFCPMGPCLTHVSTMPAPDAIALRTEVNGEIRQQGNTADLIFPVAHLISLLSRGMRLEPGDIIATGTPAGVGAGFKPPRFLRPGDEVTITIDGIGSLRNTFA